MDDHADEENEWAEDDEIIDHNGASPLNQHRQDGEHDAGSKHERADQADPFPVGDCGLEVEGHTAALL
jgi:hypothetical protein